MLYAYSTGYEEICIVKCIKKDLFLKPFWRIPWTLDSRCTGSSEITITTSIFWSSVLTLLAQETLITYTSTSAVYFHSLYYNLRPALEAVMYFMFCINHISLSVAQKGLYSVVNNFLIHGVKHPSSFKKVHPCFHEFHVSAYQVAIFIMFVLHVFVGEERMSE